MRKVIEPQMALGELPIGMIELNPDPAMIFP